MLPDNKIAEEVAFIYMIDLLKHSMRIAEERVFSIANLEITEKDLIGFLGELKVFNTAIQLLTDMAKHEFTPERVEGGPGLGDGVELVGRMKGINVVLREIAEKIAPYQQILS